jgi:hypothetical protein
MASPDEDARGPDSEDAFIVACCRMPSVGVSVRGPHRYLDRARALTRRAEALGAHLIAWGSTTVSFAWDLDSTEEAITLAVGLRDQAAPPEAQWTCGIAEGHLEPLAPGGQRAGLAWGEPLLRAIALARIAASGEVLLDTSLTALRNGELASAGVRAGIDVDREVRGVKLDLDSPWLHAADASALAGGALEAPPTASGEREEPEAFASRMLELTKRALVAGNTQSLQRLSEGLRATGEHDALADRMRAMARLSRGQFEESLHVLRQSRMAAEGEPPAVRCQAALTLALALQTTGFPDDALLCGLDALARAREGRDSRAQAACLAFLAKLFARVGAAEGAKKIGLQLVTLGRRPSFMALEEVEDPNHPK